MKKQFLASVICSAMPMMAGDGPNLQMSYPTQGEIPTGYDALYTENNGVWNLTGVAGIKTQDDVNRLQNALTMERNDHSALKAKYKVLGDRDVNQILTDLDRIPALEAGQGGDPAQLEAQVNARLTQEKAPLERQVAELQGQLTDATGKVSNYEIQNTRRSVGDEIRKAATEAKVLPEAIDDIIALGYNIFEAGDTGVIAKSDAAGVTPGIMPSVWLTDLKRTKPYFFPASQGAGANGGGANGGGANPFSKDGWNMTDQGRLVREDRAKAEQLAQAVGTTIGGPRPQ